MCTYALCDFCIPNVNNNFGLNDISKISLTVFLVQLGALGKCKWNSKFEQRSEKILVYKLLILSVLWKHQLFLQVFLFFFSPLKISCKILYKYSIITNKQAIHHLHLVLYKITTRSVFSISLRIFSNHCAVCLWADVPGTSENRQH